MVLVLASFFFSGAATTFAGDFAFETFATAATASVATTTGCSLTTFGAFATLAGLLTIFLVTIE